MTFDFDYKPSLRSSWNSGKLVVRGPLTDKKIEKYRKRGWYDEDFREARRELMAKKASKHRSRDGSFIKAKDGRLIYSPL